MRRNMELASELQTACEKEKEMQKELKIAQEDLRNTVNNVRAVNLLFSMKNSGF